MEPDPEIVVEECQGVYHPSDDTFLLLWAVSVEEGERVLEMGCGTGLIALHCAARGAEVTAADLGEGAVECARFNARRNGLEMEVIRSDMFSGLGGRFDAIIFNPPYLPVEEEGDLESAWSGGEGGVSVLSRFLEEAPGHLNPGGRIYLILSSKMDQKRLKELLSPFYVRRLGGDSFFFERLDAVELRR